MTTHSKAAILSVRESNRAAVQSVTQLLNSAMKKTSKTKAAPAAQGADQFTQQQIEDWKSFERVRAGGRYNMFDPNARRESGLDQDEYSFVMRNFSALKIAATT